MFIHIFTYRFKCLIRDRELVFWTMLFPLLLATLFNMAFGRLDDLDAFKTIPIAVVDDSYLAENQDFKEVLTSVSSGEEPFFILTQTNLETAKGLLEKGEISAYIFLDPEIQMMTRESGINQNIVKIFIEEYKQTSLAITGILSQNPESLSIVLQNLGDRLTYLRDTSMNSAKPNVVLNYFYSLIAMACIYGAFWGVKEITDIQADLSAKAARVNLAPVHKMKTFLYSLSAALMIQYTQLLLLLGYLVFILHIDFGIKIGYVLFTTFVGALVGITLGAFISVLVKKNEGMKIALVIGISMMGSFLAGMMYDKMRYIIQQNVPILSYLNPVNLLTDAFYSLYYYDTFTRYWRNIGYLGILTLLLWLGTYLIIRRRKYANL